MALDQTDEVVERFFINFELASNTFERGLLAGQFSDPFMAADPNGTIQVVKMDDFLAGISKRQAFFQSLGFQFVKIKLYNQTQLDDHFVMAKAETFMRFEKEPGQFVDLNDFSTYILYIKNGSAKIVFYTTHQDLIKILQEKGLLPSNQ